MIYGTVQFVINKVCDTMSLPIAEVLSKQYRSKEHQLTRAYCCYFAMLHTDLSYKKISNDMNNVMNENNVRRNVKLVEEIFDDYSKGYMYKHTKPLLHLDWYFKKECNGYYKTEETDGRGILPPRYPYTESYIGASDGSKVTVISRFKRQSLEKEQRQSIGVRKRNTSSQRYLQKNTY